MSSVVRKALQSIARRQVGARVSLTISATSVPSPDEEQARIALQQAFARAIIWEEEEYDSPELTSVVADASA